MPGIDLKFNFVESLLTEVWRLERFIEMLRYAFPSWVTNLQIVRGHRHHTSLVSLSDAETASTVIATAIEKGTTFHTLQAHFGRAVSTRRLGSAEIRGSDSALTVVVSFDDDIFTQIGESYIWGNSLTLQVRGKLAKPGRGVSMLDEIFWQVCRDLQPGYAFACAIEEFDGKNMKRDERGIRSVGNDISKHFPGLYWLNFFRSDPMQQVLGLYPLLPSCVQAVSVESGLGFKLGDNPYFWNSSERWRCEEEVRQAFGQNLFYDRNCPEINGAQKLRQLILSYVKCVAENVT